MARLDVTRLVRYLDHYESFDEIVVLTNDDFNDGHLRFFLQTYFPEQLRKFPGSRFTVCLQRARHDARPGGQAGGVPVDVQRHK